MTVKVILQSCAVVLLDKYDTIKRDIERLLATKIKELTLTHPLKTKLPTLTESPT